MINEFKIDNKTISFALSSEPVASRRSSNVKVIIIMTIARIDFNGTFQLLMLEIQLEQWNLAVHRPYRAISSRSKYLSFPKFRMLI